MGTGAVSKMKVNETVTTMAVPLVAYLLRDWVVDSVLKFKSFFLHFAFMNFVIMAKLTNNITANVPNE